MARKHTHPYPADFRQKVVELARSGRGTHDLAAEFKIAGQTIRNWIKQADVDTGRRSDGLTTAEHEERCFARKTGSSRSSAKFWEKLQPGSLARPIRFPQGLRIRESAPGHLAGNNAGQAAKRDQRRALFAASFSRWDDCWEMKLPPVRNRGFEDIPMRRTRRSGSSRDSDGYATPARGWAEFRPSLALVSPQEF